MTSHKSPDIYALHQDLLLKCINLYKVCLRVVEVTYFQDGPDEIETFLERTEREQTVSTIIMGEAAYALRAFQRAADADLRFCAGCMGITDMQRMIPIANAENLIYFCSRQCFHKNWPRRKWLLRGIKLVLMQEQLKE